MRHYLLDTNTVSHAIKGVPQVQRRLARVPMDQLAISAVTEGELWYGVAKRREAPHLTGVVTEFLLRIAVLAWNSDAARRYGELRASLEREAQPLGNLDLMIAAHALSAEAILVTSDLGFERIKGLHLQDWTKN